MRILTTVIAAWLCLVLSLSAQNGISYRLSDNHFDEIESELYVDLEIRADGSQFILADQYYRFYFDSENMTLDHNYSQSHLPKELYRNVELIESINGFDASAIGALNYDKNLGFVNIYIELADAIVGGSRIAQSDGWVKICTLKFGIKEGTAPSRASWAREVLTAQYASAYTIVSEWIQEDSIEPLMANSYSDLNFVQSQARNNPQVSINIGPNPATEYIRIKSTEILKSGSFANMSDIAGKQISRKYFSNRDQVKFSVLDIPSGTYIVEVYDDQRNRIDVQKVIVAQ